MLACLRKYGRFPEPLQAKNAKINQTESAIAVDLVALAAFVVYLVTVRRGQTTP